MHFDWRKFCDTQHIPYVDKGPNTARNHISIACPMCGDDPSQHMGLHLNPHDPKWGCFRDARHRGRNPIPLIAKLLKCSIATAEEWINTQRPEFDAFALAAAKLSAASPRPVQEARQAHTLRMPDHFKPITHQGYGYHFLEYLRSRGFDKPERLVDIYSLHYSLVNSWQWRLIIPFFDNGALIGWTGRSIDKRQELRYLTLPSDRDAAARLGSSMASVDMASYIWERDIVLEGGRTLIVTEGPMDALKLSWYCSNPAIKATCCFGMPKEQQVHLLARAARGYESVLVILDQEEYDKSWELADEIGELSGTNAIAVPIEEKDPGSMNKEQVRGLLHRWA